MRTFAERISGPLGWISRILGLVGGAILLFIMALIFYSVVMRYVFNAPPIFTLDTVQVALVPVAAFAILYAGWTNGHVAVDVITELMPKWITRWIEVVVRLVCAATFGLMTKQLVVLYSDSLELGEATNFMEIPHHPFIAMMVLAMGLLTLMLIAQSLRALCELPELRHE